MTRVKELTKKDGGLFDKMINWYSRRNFGMIIDPLKVMALSRWVLAAAGAFETAIGRAKSVNIRLKELRC